MRRIRGLDLAGQYPKHWDLFVGQRFDYVITLCGRAAEICPVFPADPERIEWHFDDPATMAGTEAEKQRAFDRTASEITARLRIWLALPRLCEAIKEP